MKRFNFILFDGFETLDAFGPAEVIGELQELYCLSYHSMNGGMVKSSQQIPVGTLPFAGIDPNGGVLLVPGGSGTRALVDDAGYIERLRALAEQAEYVLTVCTGSALLAKTNLLDGRKATTNKRAFGWASSNGKDVNWVKKARWVKDGKFYTASGVSAGIDMTLGFVSDMHGAEKAMAIAEGIEYVWNPDMGNDPFAVSG